MYGDSPPTKQLTADGQAKPPQLTDRSFGKAWAVQLLPESVECSRYPWIPRLYAIAVALQIREFAQLTA
jgi:hypothetical protein